MYVKKLELFSIRSFDRATIEFSKGINLIVGANNSGKSTILRALLKLQQRLPGLTKEDVRKSYNTGQTCIDLFEISGKDKTMFPLRNSPDPSIQTNEIVLLNLWDNSQIGKSEEQVLINQNAVQVSATETEIKIDKIVNDVYGTIKYFYNFSGFSSMEDEGNFIYPFLTKRKQLIHAIPTTREASFGIVEGLQYLPIRVQHLTNPTNPFFPEYQKHCLDILGFCPGIGPSDEMNGNKVAFLALRKEPIYLESMGEGTANILGLLTILLAEENKLFVIEELENDIHPEALKKLLDLIIAKSKTNQFVISTHSNIVVKYLAGLQETKIFFTEVSIQQTGEDGHIKLPTSSIEQIENTPKERLRILEKLGYDVFDFDFFKSYILFEESSAEAIVKEFLIPEFAPSLRYKVRTIAASGAADIAPRFVDFMRLFVYIHLAPIYEKRAWVIADNDNEGQK